MDSRYFTLPLIAAANNKRSFSVLTRILETSIDNGRLLGLWCLLCIIVIYNTVMVACDFMKQYYILLTTGHNPIE